MKKIILPAVIAFLIASCSEQKKETGSAGTSGTDTIHATQDTSQVAAAYQCPMDCEQGKTYAQPGKCPVCGMDMEKKS